MGRDKRSTAGNTLTKIRVKWDYMAGKGLEMNPEKTFSGQLGKSWQWLLPQPSNPCEGQTEHHMAFQTWVGKPSTVKHVLLVPFSDPSTTMLQRWY